MDADFGATARGARSAELSDFPQDNSCAWNSDSGLVKEFVDFIAGSKFGSTRKLTNEARSVCKKTFSAREFRRGTLLIKCCIV
jgi:hypothetical protein